MPASDPELLRAYVECSDADAFGELVRRRIDFVYACALRQLNGDRHRASDLTQEVFIAVARKAPTLLHHPSLLGWLCTATRFAAVDAIRSDHSRRAREQEASAMQSSDDPAPADWNRLQPVLDAALNELSSRDREVVLARYFDRQSFAEIARDFGLSENAAQKRVDRALDRLRAALARREVTSTSAALGLILAGQPGVAAPAGLALSVTQSALTAGAAGAGAVGTGLVFLIMKKYALGLAALVATLGIGTAVLGVRADDAAQRQQAASLQVTAALARELRDVEQRVAAGTTRVQRAEHANTEWLREAESFRTAATAAATTVDAERITAELVSRRFKLAQQLVQNGDPAEALRELLWCYDVGMPRIANMGPVRSTSLLTFARLAERYPPALELLRERREKARDAARANAENRDALVEYTSLNRALKDDAENVAFLDSLPADDRRRRTVASAAFDYLVEHRRYNDAAEGRTYATMASLFEAMVRRSAPATATDANNAQRDFAIRQGATNIEVLAGSGDLANARAHATRVLAFDPSEATRAKLLEGATRAGHPEVIPAPSP